MSRDRVLFYGYSLIVIGLLTTILAPSWGDLDWQNFWAAGATVGTPNLLDPVRHGQWQLAHHLKPQPFMYPPGLAWFFEPAAHISVTAGFYINCIAMLFACALAAVIASKIYLLPVTTSFLATFAWMPAVQAGALSQFTPIALILALLAIRGLISNKPLLAGLAIGLLLYKPIDALAFILLLIVRCQWRALVVTAACAIGWYLLSVYATAGDWACLVHYAAMLKAYYPTEISSMGLLTLSLPGIMVLFGSPIEAATIAGIVLLLFAIRPIARASTLEAASFAPLITLAASVHAYMYEAVLVLPSLLYVVTRVREPWRWRLVGAAYLLAPGWMLAPLVRFDPLAIVVIGGSAIWIVSRTITLPANQKRIVDRSATEDAARYRENAIPPELLGEPAQGRRR